MHIFRPNGQRREGFFAPKIVCLTASGARIAWQLRSQFARRGRLNMENSAVYPGRRSAASPRRSALGCYVRALQAGTVTVISLILENLGSGNFKIARRADLVDYVLTAASPELKS